MARLDLNTAVGEWVAQHPQTARVFESFKLDYCCGGNKSLEQACRERHVEPKSVLAQLEVAVEKDKPLGENWYDAPLSELCDHIEKTHHMYLRNELPRLTELVAKVVAAHADRYPELNEVEWVLTQLRQELEPHMMKEERVLFPAIRQMERSSTVRDYPFGSFANPVACMEHEHNSAGEALARLRELTDDYEPPSDACQTYRVMLSALAQLESDMHQHVHKENNILFPRAVRMEADRKGAKSGFGMQASCGGRTEG